MTSTQSTHVREKLEQLMLIEGEDYLPGHMSEQVKSGTKHSKHYHLTPGAFKICLMRVQRKLLFYENVQNVQNIQNIQNDHSLKLMMNNQNYTNQAKYLNNYYNERRSDFR